MYVFQNNNADDIIKSKDVMEMISMHNTYLDQDKIMENNNLREELSWNTQLECAKLKGEIHGESRGRAKGREEGKAEIVVEMIKDGLLTNEKAAELLDMSTDELLKLL